MRMTMEKRTVFRREIFVVWIIVLVSYRLKDYLFPGGIRLGSNDSAWGEVFFAEPSILLWLSVFTSLSFTAKRKKYFDTFISFILVSIGSTILIFWGSLYLRILGFILPLIGDRIPYIIYRGYFLLYTVTPILFYLNYRIMTSPLEDNLEDHLFFLKSIFSIHSFQQNTKAFYVGTVMWAYTVITSALLLAYPQAWRPVVTSYSLAFGSSWFVFFCLISLFFRYEIFRCQSAQIYKTVLVFVVAYFLASLFSPHAALSIPSIFNIVNDLKSNMGAISNPIWFIIPVFFVLLLYFNIIIQKAK